MNQGVTATPSVIEVVHVGGVAFVAVAGEVVVVQPQPARAQRHIFIEMVGGGHTRKVRIKNGAVDAEAGHANPDNTHAQGQIGIGHSPVHVGALDLDLIAVGAHGAALAAIAPALFADFQEQHAGKALGSHGLYLHVHALHAFKLVPLLTAGGPLLPLHMMAVAPLAHEIPAVHIVHYELERALDLEIDGFGVRGSQQQTGRQHQHCKFFHTVTSPSQVFSLCDSDVVSGRAFMCRTCPPPARGVSFCRRRQHAFRETPYNPFLFPVPLVNFATCCHM